MDKNNNLKIPQSVIDSLARATLSAMRKQAREKEKQNDLQKKSSTWADFKGAEKRKGTVSGKSACGVGKPNNRAFSVIKK